MEKEVVTDNVDIKEEKKDMEKVVLKVNYETEDEKKELEPTTEPGTSSSKSEPSETEGHICSPSIESCPSPLTEESETGGVSEEREREDAESGSSMSTLSLPSR